MEKWSLGSGKIDLICCKYIIFLITSVKNCAWWADNQKNLQMWVSFEVTRSNQNGDIEKMK